MSKNRVPPPDASALVRDANKALRESQRAMFSGKLEQAQTHLDTAVELIEKIKTVTAAATAQDDLERALSDYDQAIAIDPDYVTAYVNRGVIYADQSEFDRAITDYDQAIALQPDFDMPYLNRGIAYILTPAVFQNGACRPPKKVI